MNRLHAGVLIGLVIAGAATTSRAEETAASEAARAALVELSDAKRLPQVLTKVSVLREGDLGAIQFRRALDALDPARVAAVLDARVGSATLTTMTLSGGSVRLDLVAFTSGSRARRYVDALATAVWLGRGSVFAGAGDGGRRAGFTAATFGTTPRNGNVGRWGRWVAACWADAPLTGGPGATPSAFDAAGLVEGALTAIATRDAAHEEPTIRNPWEDAAVRSDAYEEAVAAVESVCRTQFRKRPAFKAPTQEELVASLAREIREGSPGATDEQVAQEAARAAAGVLGLYMPGPHALYVVPQNIHGQPAGLEVGWLGEAMMRVIFAHELAHALDFERFDVRAMQRAAAEDGKRMNAMWAVTEGHAHWVARKAALSWGIPEAFVTAREMQGRTPDVTTVYTATRSVRITRDFFGYDEGLAFFDGVEAAKGLDGVDAVFARPPTTPEEIDRPEIWLDPEKAKIPGYDEEWMTNPIAEAVPGPAQLAEMITLKSGLRVHLAFLDEKEREDAMHGFEGGHGFRATLAGGAVVDASVIRFATTEDAQRFLRVLRRVSEAKDRRLASGTDRFEDVVYTDGVGEDGRQPGFRVTRTLVAKELRLGMSNTTGLAGQVILEMNLVDVDAGVVPTLRKAYDQYLARLAAAAAPSSGGR